MAAKGDSGDAEAPTRWILAASECDSVIRDRWAVDLIARTSEERHLGGARYTSRK